jgi:hypothetical protein
MAGMALIAGCRSPGASGDGKSLSQGEISDQAMLQLDKGLKDFAERFAVSLNGAAVQIVKQCRDRDIRKATVYWKLVTISNLRNAVYQSAPYLALADSWSLCVQMTHFFESGEGSDTFGDFTEIALQTSRELEADIRDTARKAIGDTYFKKWEESIEAFAQQYPIRGQFVRTSASLEMVQASKTGYLSWVTGLPMKPFRAFMSDTAKAIMEATEAAQRITDLASFMPEQMQWRIELLMYDLEDLESAQSALKSMEKLSDASLTLSSTAEQLPKEIENRVTAVFEQLDSKQAGIQATLKESQTTLKEAQAAVEKSDAAIARLQETITGAEELSDSIVTVTENLGDAAVKWESTVRAFQETMREIAPAPDEVQSAEPPEESEPFDIKDYERTAEETRAAIIELRALNAEVREFIDSGSAKSTARAMVLYLIVLAGAFLALLFAYRAATHRFLRRQPKQAAKDVL